MKRHIGHNQQTYRKGGRTYYPSVFCLQEHKFIGVSKIKCKGDEKVTDKHWQLGNSEFLQGYRINFDKYEKGDIVRCPVCDGIIDFRMFMSDTVPELKKVKDDKEDSVKERRISPKIDT